MNTILEQIQLYLTRVANGEVQVDDKLVEEFGELAKAAFRKMYEPEREFTLRMSAIGRPYCQQWMNKNKKPKGKSAYNEPMKFLIGDLIEAAATVILKGADVNVEETQQRVELDIGGIKLEGTYDVKINGKLWDIKSASPYSFNSKFNANSPFERIHGDDPFGYVAQGYLYAEAAGVPFGGWIAVNKSTGEYAVAETPIVDRAYKKEALRIAENNIKDLKSDAEFRRMFEALEETFNGKKTGNKYLGVTCSYCPWKEECWSSEGGVTHAPEAKSKAKNPKWKWYLGKFK